MYLLTDELHCTPEKVTIIVNSQFSDNSMSCTAVSLRNKVTSGFSAATAVTHSAATAVTHSAATADKLAKLPRAPADSATALPFP